MYFLLLIKYRGDVYKGYRNANKKNILAYTFQKFPHTFPFSAAFFLLLQLLFLNAFEYRDCFMSLNMFVFRNIIAYKSAVSLKIKVPIVQEVYKY